jgi:SNF2-related domain
MTSPTSRQSLKYPEQLTDDQHRSIGFLQDREAAGLWADVGTGKTVAALTAAKRLLDGFDVRRVLVVGPRLVAERVWAAEVNEWSHLRGVRVSRIVGNPEERLAAIDADADVYTISRDNVCWLEEQFIDLRLKRQIKRWPWDLVILDECQSFKAQSSKRFKSMRKLRRLFPRIWLLTGSLMPQGYRDLWSQLYLLDGGQRLGTTEDAYLRRFFDKEVNDGIPSYEIKGGAAEEIDALIADVFCVMRDAQPPAPSNFITVELSKEERYLYNRMVRTSVLQIGDKQISAVNAGVLWGKLLQMANGAVYDETHKWHDIHKRKLDALWELLESLPRPVIIGYGFVHDVERIFGNAPRHLGRFSVLRTNKSLDQWRRGEIDIGVMHPASAGHGLNDLYISGAENLVWFGFTSNREFYDQLNGRLAGGHRRTGRKVCIHHLVTADTMDDEARALLDHKGDQQTTAQIRVAQRLVKTVTCPGA